MAVKKTDDKYMVLAHVITLKGNKKATNGGRVFASEFEGNTLAELLHSGAVKKCDPVKKSVVDSE